VCSSFGSGALEYSNGRAQSPLASQLWSDNSGLRKRARNVRSTYVSGQHHVRPTAPLPVVQFSYSETWSTNGQSCPSQEIPSILWNPKVQCRIHNSLYLSWVTAKKATAPHPTSWKSKWHRSRRFTHQKPVSTPSLTIRATCPAHLILLDFITRTFVEQCRSLSSSLCSFLHSHLTSYPLATNIPLNTLFSTTLSLRSSLNVRNPYKTTSNSEIVHF